MNSFVHIGKRTRLSLPETRLTSRWDYTANHIQVELTIKGNTYLVSQSFLAQQYRSPAELLPTVTEQAQVTEVAELQRQLAERDQTI